MTQDSQDKYALAIGVKEKPNPTQDPNSQDTSQAFAHLWQPELQNYSSTPTRSISHLRTPSARRTPSWTRTPTPTRIPTLTNVPT